MFFSLPKTLCLTTRSRESYSFLVGGDLYFAGSKAGVGSTLFSNPYDLSIRPLILLNYSSFVAPDTIYKASLI
jgi:hypothetical protein